jgi:hypothetical protein
MRKTYGGGGSKLHANFSSQTNLNALYRLSKAKLSFILRKSMPSHICLCAFIAMRYEVGECAKKQNGLQWWAEGLLALPRTGTQALTGVRRRQPLRIDFFDHSKRCEAIPEPTSQREPDRKTDKSRTNCHRRTDIA